MKNKNYSKKFKISLIFGVIILLLGILLTALNVLTDSFSSVLISVGQILIIVSYVRMIKYKNGPAKDELTRKIADRAAAYSWFYTLIVLFIIFWIDYFKLIFLTVEGVISILYVVMIFTMIFYQQWFWKKGDL